MKSIRLMMADDHPMIIAGIARSLADEGCELVGEAYRAEQVIATFEALKPDVLVLDINFGEGKNGLEVGAELIEGRVLQPIRHARTCPRGLSHWRMRVRAQTSLAGRAVDGHPRSC